jgi:hypothetical protein
MGGVQAPGSQALATSNVAYQTMPSRPGAHGRAIPVPLGLVQLAADFPTFDTQDPDFSLTRLANLALNPPFFLELSSPGELDGDIALRISRNSFAIDWLDAQQHLPQQPIDFGSSYSQPLFGLGLLGARTYVSPVVTLTGEVTFDDALFGVVADGQPILPNSAYNLHADGGTMAGTSFHVGWSDGGWGRRNGDGLYVGTYAKYILGLTVAEAETRFTLSTSDTIFGDADPLDVGYEARTRYAPFGRFGNGVGFDAGVAYRLGRVDFGVGVRDLGSSVHWSRTIVQQTALDTLTNEVVTGPEVDEPYTLRIPTQTTLNVGWTGERTVLAADFTTSSWSSGLHLGAERRVRFLALRGGVLTDDRDRLQYAWGFGLGVSKLWFDVGFQTHNQTLTGERGLTLGTSLAIR